MLKGITRNEFSSHCSNLTIFILTYNRPEALTQQLARLRNFPGNIIILDGGKSADIHAIEKDENWIRVHTETFRDRFNEGANFLATDYALTFSDDDILIPTGINLLMQEISKGQSDSIFGRMLYAYPLRQSWGFQLWKPAYENLTGRRVYAENAVERARDHFSRYTCVYFYSVMKSEVWIETFTKLHLESEKFSSPFPIELAYEFAGSLAGNSEIIPVICGIRVKDLTPTWRNSETQDEVLSVTDWLNRSEYSKEVRNFKNALSALLPLSIHTEMRHQIVDECLSEYSKVEQEWSLNNMRLKPEVRNGKFTLSNFRILRDICYIKFGMTGMLIAKKTRNLFRGLTSESISSNEPELKKLVSGFFEDSWKKSRNQAIKD